MGRCSFFFKIIKIELRTAQNSEWFCVSSVIFGYNEINHGRDIMSERPHSRKRNDSGKSAEAVKHGQGLGREKPSGNRICGITMQQILLSVEDQFS